MSQAGPHGRVLYARDELLAKDLSDQTVVVTGGNSGVGLATVKQMAKQGATVVLACRRPNAGEEAVQAIRAEGVTQGTVDVLQLDLSDYASVRTFAAAVNEKYSKVHVLCNNAGIMAHPLARNAQGHEMQLATNFLGHFLLTNLLMDKLKASTPSRIVNLSSCYHWEARNRTGVIDFEDPNFEKREYDPWTSYAQSKLANVLHTRELAKRLEGTGVHTYSVHPGWVNSGLMTHLLPRFPGSSVFTQYILMPILRTQSLIEPWEGVQTSLHCILAPTDELRDGEWYAQYGGDGAGAGPGAWPKETSPNGQNMEDAARLWTLAEELVRE